MEFLFSVTIVDTLTLSDEQVELAEELVEDGTYKSIEAVVKGQISDTYPTVEQNDIKLFKS